ITSIIVLTASSKKENILLLGNSILNYRYIPLIVIALNSTILVAILMNPSIMETIYIYLLSGSEGALLSVRKAITASTGGYMSPGIIKQVRDVISPILISSYIIFDRKYASQFMFWVALAFLIIAIFIGGQRFPIVLLMAMISFSVSVRFRMDRHGFNIPVKRVMSYA